MRFEAPEKLTAAGRMATIPLGGIDPHAYVKDMELDGVAGGVLYPSQGLTIFWAPDSALLSAIFQAYNDWPADCCRPYPARLKGIAMLNGDDVAEAVAELQRAAKIGLAGAMITLSPAPRWARNSAPTRENGRLTSHHAGRLVAQARTAAGASGSRSSSSTAGGSTTQVYKASNNAASSSSTK